MKKRLLSLALVLILALTVVGCNKQEPTTGNEGGEEELGFKIGIMTGTVSQGEEEFRAAENLVKKYGSDKVKHVTTQINLLKSRKQL